MTLRPSARLEQHSDEVLTLAARHHATEPQVFGSVARGEDAADSDLDVLVRFTDGARLFDEIGLRAALSDLLGMKVDLIGVDTLQGTFRDRVFAEAVPL